jgi:hypothetical protein
MQTRKSLFKGDRPPCPVDPQHPVHCHGQYDRYADCHELTKSKWIDRFLCYLCRHTIGVLPDDTLPYRAICVAKVQACFDAKAAEEPEPAVSEVERGCLKRAWLRFGQRLNALALLLGQMLQTRQSTAAKPIWTQLRRLGNLERILHLLGRKFKTSLLLDYRCLKPWPVADPTGS